MKFTISAALLFAFLVSGCTTHYHYALKDDNLSLQTPSLQALSKRHLQYWELRSTKDFKSSYGFELPYQRYIHSLDWYLTFNSPNNAGFQTTQKEITISEEGTKAVIETIASFNGKISYLNDTWFLVDGTWYHQFNDNLLR